MTHPGTGNQTWQDYPNTSTPITAASLEAMETVLDTVGSKAPRSVPACEVRLTANASITAAAADVFAQGNWSVAGTDSFAMVKVPPGSGTYTYIQVPTGWGGRYAFRYHATVTGMGAGATHAGKITLNATAVTSSVGTSANTAGGSGGDGTVIDVLAEVTLVAGDRIYWANWASVNATLVPSVSGINVPTAVFARYLGPA